MDVKWYAKRSIIYDIFPYTTIEGIVSTQSNTLTYDVASSNHYQQLVLNAVSDASKTSGEYSCRKIS